MRKERREKAKRESGAAIVARGYDEIVASAPRKDRSDSLGVKTRGEERRGETCGKRRERSKVGRAPYYTVRENEIAGTYQWPHNQSYGQKEMNLKIKRILGESVARLAERR